MRIKKIFSFLLCFTTIFTFFGCGQIQGSQSEEISQSGSGGTLLKENIKPCLEAPTGIPVYDEGDLHFDIIGFGMPAIHTEAQIANIKEAGFTAMYVDPWSGCSLNSEKLGNVLELFGKYDIDAYISMDNGWANRGNGYNYPKYTWRSLDLIQTDYTQYSAFKGILVFDEPGGKVGNREDKERNDFDFLEKQYELYKGLWTEDHEWGKFKTGSYKDYLFMVNGMGDIENTAYPLINRIYPLLENEVIASIDSYPLYFDSIRNQAYVGEKHLTSYEPYAVYARDHENAKFWTFAQVTDLEYSKRSDGKAWLTEADIRFQHNISMAFGAVGFEYFVYGDAAEYLGMISSQGARSVAYDYCKNVNMELKAFEHVFLNFDWQGVIPVVGSKNSMGYNEAFENLSTSLLESSDRLRYYEAQRDTLIGCFKDGEGRDGYMFVNYHDPYYKKSDQITVRFNNATKALMYVNGAPQTVELDSDGGMTFKLAHGGGAFIIPVV